MPRRRLNSIHDEDKISWRMAIHAMRYIPRFFKDIWSVSPSMLLANMFLRIAGGVLPLFLLWVGKLIVDEVVLITQAKGSVDELWLYVGVELGLVVISELISRLIELMNGLIGDLYSNASSVKLIKKTAEVELVQLEDPDFYDKLEQARRQTLGRVSLMTMVFGLLQNLLTIGSLLSVMVLFEPLLLILLIIAVIPAFINELKFSNKSYSLTVGWSAERRELDYLRQLGASEYSAKEIKLFHLSDYIAKRFKSLSDLYYDQNKKLQINKTKWGSFFSIVGSLSYYGAYVLIIYRVIHAELSIGDMTFLSASFSRLQGQLQLVFSSISRMTNASLHLQNYFEFLDYQVDPNTSAEDQIDLPKIISKGFEFKNVSFRYPSSKVDVIKNVSFKLHVNERLALVGENGAGKSTLIKLILRFYEPSSGIITLDGTDIRLFNKQLYQERFGVIFQDYLKYHFSLSDNIAVGSIEHRKDHERLKSAAEQSLADQVVSQLPEGYNQLLGRRFHNGVDLSGGQWQKIALARAYMKDADVVILDEPTSALDAKAEDKVFQRFIGLAKNKTAIIISHRFSTVRMADRIVVLKNGELVEQGTHQQLIANDQLYAELFNIQAAGYQ